MKIDIIIPEGLFEITLEQYQKFVALKSEDELFLAQKCVEIFCNVPLILVNKMPLNKVKKISNQIMSFFEHKPKLRMKTDMDGVEYGFVPNLEELSLGEYVDIDETINDWQKMHTTMAVLYRPIVSKRKDKYQIEEYDGTKETEYKMKELKMDVVLGALFFFYRLGIDLSQHLIPYLQDQENQTSAQSQTLPKSGDGTQHFINSVKVMLQDLEKLVNSPSMLH